MIDAVVINNKVFIYNAEDVDFLRRNHRITGNLVGCLPNAPRQNTHHGLPLLLIPEEATMLVQKGILRLVWYDRLHGVPLSQEVEKFNKMREDSYKQQDALYREERKRKLLELGSKIEEERRKKGRSNKVEEKRDEVSRASTETSESTSDNLEIAKDSMMVQLFIECPWIDKHEVKPAEWNFPIDDDQKMRLLVYTDLWEKSYYLTAGGKFGGDFLVYPGDPTQYHASYIAICVPLHSTLSGRDLIARGRIGTSVKKIVLLCSPKGDGSIQYLTLKWTGII